MKINMDEEGTNNLTSITREKITSTIGEIHLDGKRFEINF